MHVSKRVSGWVRAWAFERLEPDDGRLSSPILRGRDGVAAVLLPDWNRKSMNRKSFNEKGTTLPSANVAPPKSTGGGGFVFEDKVGAWFLAHMLTDEPPFEAELGRIERIDFQTRPDGWFLDDLLLTLAASDGPHRCALSVKSNVQFGSSSAPSDFVRTAWKQFLHKGTACFDSMTDYMGLVTAPLHGDVRSALAFVLETARKGDPQLLPARYAKTGWANKTKRALFESFSCPPDLAKVHGVTSGDTGRLLALLQFLQFDFEELPSESEKIVIERCRRALKSGDVDEARKLWDRLLQISADRRPKAGCITRESLLDDLRSQFRLADRPDHRPDWDQLKNLTTTCVAQVYDSIGGRVRLQRDQEVEKLQHAVDTAPGVVLLGHPGVGKSAIAKRCIEQRLTDGQKCLWFEARSFGRADLAAFEADLRLTHGLTELLRSVPDSSAVLVLDGLDRLYDARAFSLLASLLNALELHRQGSPWHIVVTCQTQEWPRLQQSLLQAGIATTSWRLVECEPLSAEELKPVWDAIPRAARLQYQARLHPLFVNLKILDLIASRLMAGGQVPTADWVGESDVAAWFWESQIAHGPDGPSRARFVTLLAERQAAVLRPAVPLYDFDVSELHLLTGLVNDRVCRQTTDDQVVFEHDLFGDWARLRVLMSRSDDLDFLKSRIDLPLWHRAIRLYGTHLLEHVGNIDKWRAILSTLTGKEDGGVRDLLLESTIFAADPLPLLERIRPDLVRDNGQLLRRLLGRFLAFATLPDPFFTALARADGHDDVEIAARYRYPNWPYWLPMIRFLHKHRAEFLSEAPVRVGRVVELWLSHVPEGTILRREAAELGLMLGERALQARHAYAGTDYKHRKLYYRAALAGAIELPDEVAAFALRASERSTEPKEADSAPLGPDLLPKSIRLDPRFDPDEPVPDPWPDGPRNQVDDDFREVVLDTGALIPLIRARLATAREVALAALIKPRRRFEWRNHWYESTQLDLVDSYRWHPPLYIDGPFLGFLRINFDEGLDLIARLVDFATERWSYYARIDAREYETKREGRDDENRLLGRLMSEWHQAPGSVMIPLEDEAREYLGDSRVYGWSAGLGNPPKTVTVALMALEQYFYLELDEDRPIDKKVRAVLERVHSVAFLKVLCDVGRREPALFEGPILPLIAVPEVYFWDISASVHGRMHLMIGSPMRGEWFVRMAKRFHELEHRKLDLRLVALEQFFNRPSTRAFFEETRKSWETRISTTPEGPFHEFLRQLIISFDPQNYRIEEHPEHGHILVNVRTQELEAEQADARRASEERWQVTFLPVRCRQIIDEGIGLKDDQLEAFWDDLQHIAAKADLGATSEGQRGPAPDTSRAPGPTQFDESSRDDVANAVTGAIALLVRFHGDWLAQHTDRKQWCLDQLQAVVLNPPPRDKFDVPESVASWTWDCFAAEALPVLWAQDPSDTELRHLVARMVFAPHYVTVAILFRRCAEQRAVLGLDFGRLQRLLFEWAYVRNRIAFVSAREVGDVLNQEQVNHFIESVDQWAQERVVAFIEGRSPSTCAAWMDIDDPVRFQAIDELRKRWHSSYYLDLGLVRAAHAWLPTPDQALDRKERHEWLGFWREALSFVLQRTAKSDERDEHPYPYEDELWVLDGVAAALQYMDPEERPEDLWRAILDLPSEAHHWPKVFLQAFYRHGLHQDLAPPTFASTMRAMVEYVLDRPTEADSESRWFYREEVWEALLGIDWLTLDYWDARHRDLVERSQDLFERWVMRRSGYGRHLAKFARWLERTAAEPIRLPGLVWLNQSLAGTGTERVFDRESTADAVASLLNVIWRQDEERLRRNTAAFTAFRSLLRWLVDRQNPVALELLGRIGGLA